MADTSVSFLTGFKEKSAVLQPLPPTRVNLGA
jgi:hypothetical protein